MPDDDHAMIIFFMIRRRPASTLFPYTTLFRSRSTPAARAGSRTARPMPDAGTPSEPVGLPSLRHRAPHASRRAVPARPRCAACRTAPPHTRPSRGTPPPHAAARTRPASENDTPHRPARPASPCVWWRTPSTRSCREPESAARARWSSCRPRTGRRVRPRAGRASLQVVELLAQLLELAFHGDHGPRDPGVVGLRPDGIHLAQQLLREEPELFPDRPVAGERRATRRQVSP